MKKTYAKPNVEVKDFEVSNDINLLSLGGNTQNPGDIYDYGDFWKDE